MAIDKKLSELFLITGLKSTDSFPIHTEEGTKRVFFDTVHKAIISNSAEAHNGIYRGRDLTNVYTVDEICTMVSNGNYTDLFIGDYFDVTISTIYTASEVVRCVIAGFNTYYNSGDTALTTKHLVIVPATQFTATSYMNETHVTTGGYLNSYMYQTVLPVYAEALQSALGGHLLTYRNLLTNAVSETGDSMAGAGRVGYSSNWEWADTQLCLMSEINVYGANVFSSSFYDTGIQNRQLPLFRLNPSMINNGRGWYWLKNVAYSTDFAHVDGRGYSISLSAGNSGGVRPYFLIG